MFASVTTATSIAAECQRLTTARSRFKARPSASASIRQPQSIWSNMRDYATRRCPQKAPQSSAGSKQIWHCGHVTYTRCMRHSLLYIFLTAKLFGLRQASDWIRQGVAKAWAALQGISDSRAAGRGSGLSLA